MEFNTRAEGSFKKKVGDSMSSNKLMLFLLFIYVVIMLYCIKERNWAKALYWFAACLLLISVLWGFK